MTECKHLTHRGKLEFKYCPLCGKKLFKGLSEAQLERNRKASLAGTKYREKLDKAHFIKMNEIRWQGEKNEQEK